MNLVSFQIKSKCFIAGGVNRMPDSVSEARCYILFRVLMRGKKILPGKYSAFFGDASEIEAFFIAGVLEHKGHDEPQRTRSLEFKAMCILS